MPFPWLSDSEEQILGCAVRREPVLKGKKEEREGSVLRMELDFGDDGDTCILTSLPSASERATQLWLHTLD